MRKSKGKEGRMSIIKEGRIECAAVRLCNSDGGWVVVEKEEEDDVVSVLLLLFWFIAFTSYEVWPKYGLTPKVRFFFRVKCRKPHELS